MRRTERKSNKGKLAVCVFAGLVMVVMLSAFAKGNPPKVVGYTYDSGNTVWEMATKHCPDGMKIRDFAKEIAKVNGIENNVVYKNCSYKIPVYKRESDYLDMTTVVGYELSDDGVLLLTNDGNGYFIEK